MVLKVSGKHAKFQGRAALEDIRHVLQELKELSREAQPDAGRIHRNVLVLHARFEDLTASAQTLINRFERGTGLPAPEIRRLIHCSEQFAGELVIAADNISETIRDIEAAGLERLLHPLAERSLRDDVDATPENIATLSGQLRSRWEFFCNWFISQPGNPSNAEMLRERIRASIPALLSVIAKIKDRQIQRVDRSNDFRVLARWFAQAESDAEAHQLWRAVFGLGPARHLIINDATLDDYEAQDVPASTSWLDAPALRISIRSCGGNSQTMLGRIVDRTAEKEKLAAAAREEALRILNAQSRFGTGRRMRLSELECLNASEFDLFLDLLAEAMSATVFPAEAVDVVSGDGCLRVKLEPTGDGREALIVTAEGIFLGPDHWISVEQISTEEVVM
jgi:uncharacterized protein (TIGR02677 family)